MPSPVSFHRSKASPPLSHRREPPRRTDDDEDDDDDMEGASPRPSQVIQLLTVPVSATGPPLTALFIELPGRVFVTGRVTPVTNGDTGAEPAATIRLVGSSNLVDHIVASTEAGRAGSLALRVFLNVSKLEKDPKPVNLARHRRSGFRARSREVRHGDDKRDDESERDDDLELTLLVDIALPRPLR